MLRTPDDIDPSNLSPPAYKYWSMGAYNNSKLCNILFAHELARRWSTISVFSCHPGNLVSSNLARQSWLFRLLFAFVRPFTKSLVNNSILITNAEDYFFFKLIIKTHNTFSNKQQVRLYFAQQHLN